MLGLKVVLMVVALICLVAGVLRRDVSPTYYPLAGAVLFMWLVVAMMIWPN